MDWIESFFHVTPDAGSGGTDTAIFSALSMALAVALGAWRRTSRRRSPGKRRSRE
jgi:MYXO-CTERM domain-containing protein